MSMTLLATPTNWATFQREMQDRLHALGDIPSERMRMDPRPGTVTIDDLLKPGNEGCELVDGTLVEMAKGGRSRSLVCGSAPRSTTTSWQTTWEQ